MAEHNASSQTNVVRNDDPALDVDKEHHHEHLHHSAHAEKGRVDNIVYTSGTTAEKSTVPDADPLDNALHNHGHPERVHHHDIPQHVSKKEDDLGIDYDAAEKGTYDGSDEGSRGQQQGEMSRGHRFRRFYKHWKLYIHLFILALFTGSEAPSQSTSLQALIQILAGG
jgi:concentrative nucleoside transporter, CNT family